MNKIGFIISLIVMIIVFLFEFLFGFIERQKERKIVKPFCLVTLMVTLYFFGLRNFLVYLGLCFGLIGDIVLIWPKNKIMFLLGTGFFFANHVVYIYLMSSLLSYQIPMWTVVGLCLFGILFPFFGYRILHEHTGILTIPGLLYFYILFMECLFSIFLLTDSKSPVVIMILVGNLFFIGSDTTLSLTHFMFDIKRKDFYIMLTYLIAQTLISFGLCLML